MKKLTRPQLVEAINSYEGPELHDRVKREIMIELLAARHFFSKTKWQQLWMVLKA